MSNLFMPKNQKSLSDLISDEPKIFEFSEEVIVFSDREFLYTVEDLSSTPRVWRDRKNTALTYHEPGILYAATIDGYVYDALTDKDVITHERSFTSLGYYNGTLYVGTDKGKVCEVVSKKIVYEAENSNSIIGLCSHKGKLYYGFEDMVGEVFAMNRVKVRGLVNNLYSEEDTLFALTTEGVYDCYNLGNRKFRGKNIYGVFNFKNDFYYVDSSGDIFDYFEENVGSFDNDRVFDVAVVPKSLIRGVS